MERCRAVRADGDADFPGFQPGCDIGCHGIGIFHITPVCAGIEGDADSGGRLGIGPNGELGFAIADFLQAEGDAVIVIGKRDCAVGGEGYSKDEGEDFFHDGFIS